MDENMCNFFDKLYEENYAKILRFVKRKTYDLDIYEDVVQDAFLLAYKNLENLCRHENPVGWLYITTSYIIMAYLRKQKNLSDNLPLHTIDVPSLDEESSETFLCSYLPQKDAAILIKYYEFKLTHVETAKEEGISISASKMRLKRAKEKFIKKYLDSM